MNKTKKYKFKKNQTIKYRPSLNDKLSIRSLTSKKPLNFELCNNLLKIKLNGKNKCLDYNNKLIVNYLLYNLKHLKHLKVNNLIPPKQLYGNCWFNTMFVSLFFSDKGRIFFRFFRKLMITGKKIDGKYIIDRNLRELFFIFNLFIEASYNRYDKKDKLFNAINVLTKSLNTNYIIKEIYKYIQSTIKNSNIPDIDEAGNPFDYYLTIMKYLNYDVLKILNIDISEKSDILKVLSYKSTYKPYEVLIINDFNSKTHYSNIVNINNIKYKLDSIILTNKDFFEINTDKHFVSVLTINGDEYKFDGTSYSRLTKFKWKNKINTDVDWTFYYKKNFDVVYNFTYGYKILLYFRIN